MEAEEVVKLLEAMENLHDDQVAALEAEKEVLLHALQIADDLIKVLKGGGDDDDDPDDDDDFRRKLDFQQLTRKLDNLIEKQLLSQQQEGQGPAVDMPGGPEPKPLARLKARRREQQGRPEPKPPVAGCVSPRPTPSHHRRAFHGLTTRAIYTGPQAPACSHLTCPLACERHCTHCPYLGSTLPYAWWMADYSSLVDSSILPGKRQHLSRSIW